MHPTKEQMKDPKRFYTYAYLREDGSPYYIGKGFNNRVYRKHQKGISTPKDKSKIIFLKKNLTEEEAFKHEIYMINIFGRKDLGTGILRNKTDGGEGSSGIIRSKEFKRKQSEAKTGKNNYWYGKTHSEETKRKLSEANGGKSHHMYGKKHSEETKRKISEAIRGKNHPLYGISPSEETKRKISESQKGENGNAYGKKWWNDTCGNVKLEKECPGEGWILGRGKLKRKSKDTF